MILLFAPEFSGRTARRNVIDGLGKERFVLFFMAIAAPVGVGGAMLSPGDGGPGFPRSSDFGYMSGLAGHAGLRERGLTSRRSRALRDPRRASCFCTYSAFLLGLSLLSMGKRDL